MKIKIENKINIAYVLLFLITFLIGSTFISKISVVYAQNSCPSIAPYQCNNGSCTNDPDLCDQSWGGGLSNNNPTPTTSGTGQNLTTVSNSNQRCSGNLRYDKAAADECAAIAEAQGRALGYNISCSTDVRDEFIVVNSNSTGTQSTYYPDCTINGVPGFGAQTLAGYTGEGPGYTVYDPFMGTTRVYGSGYNLNPMWYSVPCSIVDSVEGRVGGGTLTGATTCTSGATQYFGSSNPVNWNSNYAQNNGSYRTNRDTQNIPTDSSYTETNASSNVRPSAATNRAGQITSYHVSSILAVLTDLVDSYRNLFGIRSGSSVINPNNSSNGSNLTGGNNTPSYIYNVSMDKTSYCTGERPLYTVTGPQNLVGSKVLWSSRFNNIATNELDSDYGYVLSDNNGQARWSGYGNTWTNNDIGSWEKEANVNNILKSVRFEVKNCPAQQNVVTCSPKNIVHYKLFSVIPTITASGGDGINYTWQAPGSTKTEGAGQQFTTSYANVGNYNITVTSGNTSDVCTVNIGG